MMYVIRTCVLLRRWNVNSNLEISQLSMWSPYAGYCPEITVLNSGMTCFTGV